MDVRQCGNLVRNKIQHRNQIGNRRAAGNIITLYLTRIASSLLCSVVFTSRRPTETSNRNDGQAIWKPQ